MTLTEEYIIDKQPQSSWLICLFRLVVTTLSMQKLNSYIEIALWKKKTASPPQMDKGGRDKVRLCWMAEWIYKMRWR